MNFKAAIVVTSFQVISVVLVQQLLAVTFQALVDTPQD